MPAAARAASSSRLPAPPGGRAGAGPGAGHYGKGVDRSAREDRTRAFVRGGGVGRAV